MRAHLRRTGGVALAAALIILLVAGAARADEDATALRRAAHHLARIQLETGLFEFDLDFETGAPLPTPPEAQHRAAIIVRQAVGAFALAKYYRHTGDASVRDATRRAIEALAHSSVPIGKPILLDWLERAGLLALPYGRTTLTRLLDALGLLYATSGTGRLVALNGEYATAYSGGTAIALLAELHYAAASGDQSLAAHRRGWRDGLLAMQIAGGGFRERPGTIEEAGYANGEAWLAFAHLADVEPPAFAARIARIDGHMKATYGARDDGGFFLWGAQAIAKRLADAGDHALTAVAIRQAEAKLTPRALAAAAPYNTCSHVEGYAATAWILSRSPGGDVALLERLRLQIDIEMAKNRSFQLREDQSTIERPAGHALINPDPRRYAGAYLMSWLRPFIRVDVTEHCISALIEIARLHPGR